MDSEEHSEKWYKKGFGEGLLSEIKILNQRVMVNEILIARLLDFIGKQQQSDVFELIKQDYKRFISKIYKGEVLDKNELMGMHDCKSEKGN